MAITRQAFSRQYDHVAVIAHGAHPEYRVEFDAPVNSGAVSIVQGSIVSLNASGEYVLGCGAGTGVNYPVPCVSLKNVADPDVTAGVAGVSRTSGGSSYEDKRTGTYSAIGGKITAIPCTAGYEIETTEYDKTATYNVNDALVAATSGGLVTKKGTAKELYTSGGQAVLGFVSQIPGTTANNYGHTRIAFFTDFIPAAH